MKTIFLQRVMALGGIESLCSDACFTREAFGRVGRIDRYDAIKAHTEHAGATR